MPRWRAGGKSRVSIAPPHRFGRKRKSKKDRATREAEALARLEAGESGGAKRRRYGEL